MAPTLDDPTPPLHPSPGFRSDTSTLPLPNDEAHRLPPPYNASASETPHQPSNKRGFINRPRVIVTLLILFSLVLIVGTSLGVIYLLLSPKYPKLAISNVFVTHPLAKHPRFLISLKAKNPNNRVGVGYEKGGRAALSFKKKSVATGPFPTFAQGDKSSSAVQMVLRASNKTMPHEIRNSILNTTSKLPLSLGLTMNVPVRMKIWTTKIWIEELVFDCKFRVNTLANSSRILYQRCPIKAPPK
ncbi:NDR1/HIN1-like protein 6 [Vitis vinifera]|uniref:NDR1/HIN1-like protein 13 n=1 Tax=Vitis vinifera TaxID=29760 RepID=A0A438FC62_VITVI|nr:NDR1/HIN1-like protein 6 [Vitis vinifera]RVW57544.1 NDR1/HIN1-like protein 13 [Vitis vinifera]|eukprot:XP_010646788.1 PREDICTED: uncharacterized protein LOC104878321 [Vitis vinifera]